MCRPVSPNTTRQHHDPDGQRYANPFLLDRHRIVHSMAFRRLQYKTQAFLAFHADHFRTRMVHSLEVAQIGMVLAGKFSANTQLTELLCLAHDLGHAPFAHAGERALNDICSSCGGFEHNEQSLRTVQYLERPYPDFPGLNLTNAVLSGMKGHSGRYDRHWSDHTGQLASQLASWADRLAYDAGDLEDALGCDIINPTQLDSLAIWKLASERLRERCSDRPFPAIRRPLCEAVQSIVIEQLRMGDAVSIELPTVSDTQLTELEEFLLNNVYLHPKMVETDDICMKIIARLFEKYRAEPSLLPKRYLRRQHEDSVERIITDFISGMTDRFCLKVYRQLFGPDDKLINSLQAMENQRS